MKVSVVIPSKDSPSLHAALESVAVAADQVGPSDVEAIVVDSSDAPVDIALDTRAGGMTLTVIREPVRRLPARLLGIRLARGRWILNLDSDQAIHPGLLEEILRSDRPAVAIPEVPPGDPSQWSHWERLVHRAHGNADREFRAHPTLDVPVIPRAYDRELLNRATGAILDDAPGRRIENLPTQHEDTVLLSYFLRVNRLSLADSLGFASVPIYHPIPDVRDTLRKFFRYGHDLGREARLVGQGSAGIDSSAWRQVYRVDYTRLARYWSRASGWNGAGLVFDSVRACAYLPGMARGYLGLGYEE